MITEIFVGIGLVAFIATLVMMLVESFHFVQNITNEYKQD
jgi:hypothetical protein